jgi:CheY-like chemotaxis protein
MKTAILLVDDDLLLLAINAELLSELGYTVTTARNGSEALTILGNGHAVHALVTDLQMPGLHGFELACPKSETQPDDPLLDRSSRAECRRDGPGTGTCPQQALYGRAAAPRDRTDACFNQLTRGSETSAPLILEVCWFRNSIDKSTPAAPGATNGGLRSIGSRPLTKT